MWKFEGIIIIILEDNKNIRLEIDIGWFDKWLYVKEPNGKPADFSPEKVTPAFVKSAILFALKAGWNNGRLQLTYQSRDFQVLNDYND